MEVFLIEKFSNEVKACEVDNCLDSTDENDNIEKTQSDDQVPERISQDEHRKETQGNSRVQETSSIGRGSIETALRDAQEYDQESGIESCVRSVRDQAVQEVQPMAG